MIEDADVGERSLVCTYPGLIETIDKSLKLLSLIGFGIFRIVAGAHIATPEVVEVRDQVWQTNRATLTAAEPCDAFHENLNERIQMLCRLCIISLYKESTFLYNILYIICKTVVIECGGVEIVHIKCIIPHRFHRIIRNLESILFI